MEFTIVIMIGYLTKGFFEADTGRILSKLVVNFTLPAAIFYSLTTSHFHFSKFAFTVAGLLSNAVLISFGFLLFSKLKDPRIRIPILLSFVGFNTGLFMYPLAESLWGPESVVNYALFDLGNSFFIFGVGKAIAERTGFKGILKVFKFPPFVVLLLSLLLNLLNVTLPMMMLNFAEMVKNANAFLVFFLVGYYLNFKSVFEKFSLIAIAEATKYVLAFFISITVVKLFSLSSFEEMNLFLAPLLPSAIMTLVYSIEKGYDAELASGLITFSTVVSTAIILTTDHLWR
ncbi:AEC family transporter [Thermotoga sp. KOL6]|uniref:AEC family transporter n=1 Tax=Thermotoga sp. KOL6 TaxID=126741 RepID=UPI000C75B841|nr:AEC family transporter [Thermotoga sp. KOL6]PLV58984.1 transporter [Thermotoga sp. KOL6]